MLVWEAETRFQRCPGTSLSFSSTVPGAVLAWPPPLSSSLCPSVEYQSRVALFRAEGECALRPSLSLPPPPTPSPLAVSAAGPALLCPALAWPVACLSVCVCVSRSLCAKLWPKCVCGSCAAQSRLSRPPTWRAETGAVVLGERRGGKDRGGQTDSCVRLFRIPLHGG